MFGRPTDLADGAFAAGTAGLTVASRLSTVPGLKVLVLEAGVS
jgi:hypothetical protein